MCGIIGIVGENPQVNIAEQMLKTQQHRGPDASKISSNQNIILGHNRLSIIDLNENANQPMISNCGRYTIVFNGEIYNYKELKLQLSDYSFKTNSDTEVLLALYVKMGKDCLNELNGMFAFAIWDNYEQKLFAARDRFGVKPFYFTQYNNELYFSSEIKTLWHSGQKKEKNLKVWSNYLTFGTYGLPNETFWKNIYQIEAGHYFEYKSNDQYVKTIKWYDFVENINSHPKLTLDELRENYYHLLIDSIKLRFRADVPVGFNISGGLDSSALLALINNVYPENNTIEAFTFYSNDQRYDELPWVKKMILQTKNKLNECLLEVDEIPELVKKISYFQDEPFGGFPTLAYSNIFKKAREKGVLVLLDGQGMDEAWAGYDYYQNSTGFIIQGTKKAPVRPEVISEEFFKLSEKEVYEKPFDDELQNLQFRDLFYTKIPRALRFNDRISMMYSTELREPFLDYRLVELAFAQDKSTKIKNGQSKWLLRELVKDFVNTEIALAPKRPLQTPQREWLSDNLKDWVASEIETIADLDWFNKKNLMSELNNFFRGDNDSSFHIWQWISVAQTLK